MENNNWSFNPVQKQSQTTIEQTQTQVGRSFLAGVFTWMGIALGISAVTAYVFGTTPEYMSYLVNANTRGLSGLGYFVMFAPLGFVLLMSFGYQKLSSTALTFLFLIYSVIMGISLSFIFLAYTHSSIFQIFVVSALMFGFMGLVGYTTKTDLTKMGSLLIMALIGVIIASIVNFFIHSEGMGYIISIITVIIFVGLTAYDVQKLKNIGASGVEYGSESTAKLSILGALTLYLDFINLFLALLRLFGSRK
jgi:FtsH-binding integral membrane protein